MDVIVCGVPNTGNRLVMGFLDFLEEDYTQNHFSRPYYRDAFIVSPMRDPVLQFLGWSKRMPNTGFDVLLDSSVKYWERYREISASHDILMIPTDRGSAVGIDALSRLTQALDSDKSAAEFGWPAIGSCTGTPTTLSDYPEPPSTVFERLKEYREWAGYA